MTSFSFIVSCLENCMTCLKKINNMYPTIKFTTSHTTGDDEPLEDRCDCDAMTSISFLDTSCSIIEGNIDTNLFI